MASEVLNRKLLQLLTIQINIKSCEPFYYISQFYFIVTFFLLVLHFITSKLVEVLMTRII